MSLGEQALVTTFATGSSLVSCPRNKHDFRRRSVGCFSRRERRAYLNRYVRSEQRGKTANWPRPGGLRSKWAAGKARGGRISRSIRNRGTTQPAAHFHRNERYAYFGDRTLRRRTR